MTKRAHFILQGKGGIGKSFVSSLLMQYLRHKHGEKSVRGFDTDQENTTFHHYKALNVLHISVMNERKSINQKGFDTLMEEVLSAEGSSVIDNGANTFTPLLSYLAENNAFAFLSENGITPVIHGIVGGGDMFGESAHGFKSLIAAAKPHPVVLWTNEHFGSLETRTGIAFQDTEFYKGIQPDISGVVTLPVVSTDTYGADIKKMCVNRLTFDEALGSGSTFSVMERQRLKNYRTSVFSQLDALEL